MSKTRNDEQKARRAYLDKCRKSGTKPISAKAFSENWAKAQTKLAKKVDKTVKKELKKAPAKKPVAKKVAVKRAKVHEVHKGDVIKFIDFDPQRIIKYALRLLCMATSEVCK